VGNLVNHGEGVDMSSLAAVPGDGDAAPLDEAAATNTMDTLLNIIQKNPVAALANGDMLPLIFFALFVGIVLARLGRRGETVHSFFVQFNDIMMEMTSLVMKVAPLGVFCLLARTFANVGFEAFLPMVKYMGAVLAALALQLGVTYMALLWVFARMGPLMFLRKFFSVAAFGFSTAT